ncbi:MAG: alpha/beta hydrolase [Candidatus Thorarchaeota archaeon]
MRINKVKIILCLWSLILVCFSFKSISVNPIAVDTGEINQIDLNSYSFDNFSHFLEIYESVSPTEKATVLDEYLSWQETAGGGFPAIQNNTHVVFIYYNPSLSLDLCGITGDFTAYNIKNMTQLEIGVSFFYYEYSFEPTSRINYFFVVDDEWILDDRNPHTSPADFDWPASELAMPEFVQPEEIVYRDNITHGQLQTLEYPWENPRVKVYIPPYYETERSYPVIYTGDGSSYTDLMYMVNILDNLIADKRISPVIIVFIDPIDFVPGEPYDYLVRMDWYNCNPDYLEYLDGLVDHIDATYSTNTSAYARCHLGFSISGLVSTYVALERPNLFKLFASQSGSFSIGQSSYQIKTKYTQASGSLDFKAWFSIGTYENNNNFGTPMVEDTEEMADICENKGWTTEIIYNVGECHIYGQWRHCLDDMLEFFFPYEEYINTEKTEIKLLFLIFPVTLLFYVKLKMNKREI